MKGRGDHSHVCIGALRPDLFTKVLKRQPFEKHRKVVLNTGAGESNDEVKQQRIAALSAWKTKLVFKKPYHDNEEAPLSKVKGRLCLRGERTCGAKLSIDGCSPGSWIMDPGGSEAQVVFRYQ